MLPALIVPITFILPDTNASVPIDKPPVVVNAVAVILPPIVSADALTVPVVKIPPPVTVNPPEPMMAQPVEVVLMVSKPPIEETCK